MIQRKLLGLSSLALAFAGAAFSAQAQDKPSTTAQPMARDKATIEAAFTKADANADGKLTKDEAAKLPAVAAKFDELDKNKDGSLSLDEFSTAVTQ